MDLNLAQTLGTLFPELHLRSISKYIFTGLCVSGSSISHLEIAEPLRFTGNVRSFPRNHSSETVIPGKYSR